MSNQLATLSPYDIAIVISQGTLSHTVTGFAEESIVSVEQQQARFDLYTGADNTPTRIHKNNTSGMVTLHLQQSSASNDILSYLLQNDLNTRDSTGLFSFLVKDNSGRSLYHADEAYISNIPSANHGTTMQLREWIIHTPKLTTFIGGNAKFSDADQAAIEALGQTVPTRWK